MHTLNGVLFSLIKEGNAQFATTWMSQGDIVPSETSQLQEDKYGWSGGSQGPEGGGSTVTPECQSCQRSAA